MVLVGYCCLPQIVFGTLLLCGVKLAPITVLVAIIAIIPNLVLRAFIHPN
jgi:hypothetical protein